MKLPRIFIAGLNSGCGKTTVATGLMGALTSMGLKVQGFKVGPDFIDPTYHTIVTNRKSRNLDEWLLPDRMILRLFQHNTLECNVAIVEGVMGLFDGVNGERGRGSTASMAELLRAPVILVLDVWGMGESAATLVAGCRALDRELNLAGVILNRVSSEKHARLCTNSIESRTKVPVLGVLPKDTGIVLPERHLGLVPTIEKPELREKLDKISSLIKENVDLEKIVEIADNAPQFPKIKLNIPSYRKTVKVGVAYDEAFNFYYQDALDALSAMGADIHFFSPIHDRTVPDDFDGIYIGGGFPEVFGKQLESNLPIRFWIKKKIEENMPVFAECGGLMYLTKSITDFEGESHSMVGALDCETHMVRALTMNYTYASVLRDNILAKTGASVKGHEFHYSRLVGVPSDARFSYIMKRGSGIEAGRDGWIEYSMLAQYMHINIAASRKYASNFIESCLRYRRK
ncbi:MAG: cobyrinate a,c-diamide synthase [Nitrososphaerota archaeon]|nr:cobyrinate a,c-diamide synthase [Nitrososphaerota archaeon]